MTPASRARFSVSIHTERRRGPYAPRKIHRDQLLADGAVRAIALLWAGIALVALVAALAGHPL